ncbi:MAG: hypothetical protein MUC36_05695 [Planctomycetes bacterium]|jgi:tetratricopeptide (TPR) repeat protein|nr:hypothetical protein [Planctomycetota bacterium]
MLVKGLVCTVLFASAPITWIATQEPRPAAPATTPADAMAAQSRLQATQRQVERDLEAARQEVAKARAEAARLQQQLGRALDALEAAQEPQRERNCAPSRSRQLMTHYRWLRDEGHADRAEATLAKVVEQVGDDRGRLHRTAHALLTEVETGGKFDDVALALVEKLEQSGSKEPHHLDTMACAQFLNGRIERAIELQRRAIAAGGRDEEFRLRLRTYEAARNAIGRPARDAASDPVTATGETLVARSDDD